MALKGLVFALGLVAITASAQEKKSSLGDAFGGIQRDPEDAAADTKFYLEAEPCFRGGLESATVDRYMAIVEVMLGADGRVSSIGSIKIPAATAPDDMLADCLAEVAGRMQARATGVARKSSFSSVEKAYRKGASGKRGGGLLILGDGRASPKLPPVRVQITELKVVAPREKVLPVPPGILADCWSSSAPVKVDAQLVLQPRAVSDADGMVRTAVDGKPTWFRLGGDANAHSAAMCLRRAVLAAIPQSSGLVVVQVRFHAESP
jgi:hypothetical protein